MMYIAGFQIGRGVKTTIRILLIPGTIIRPISVVKTEVKFGIHRAGKAA